MGNININADDLQIAAEETEGLNENSRRIVQISYDLNTGEVYSASETVGNWKVYHDEDVITAVIASCQMSTEEIEQYIINAVAEHEEKERNKPDGDLTSWRW